MTPEHLLKTLQLNDTLFPIGGFAYSDGLETAVTNGLVAGTAGLQQWLAHYIHSVFVTCDGLALRGAMEAHSKCDWDTLRALDEELTAMKPAASVRASSASLGRSLLTSVSAIHVHPDLGRARQELSNFAVIYGVVFSVLGLDRQDALLSFAYARLAGMISGALRLMPIGQQQAQAVLGRALDDVPEAVEQILNSRDLQLTSFSPLLEIQQMNHQYLYTKLFRS
jgi:urease accessory protein